MLLAWFPQNPYQVQCHETFHSIFPSKNFVDLSLTFRSLIHFEFTFAYGLRVQNHSLCMLESSFPNTICWKDCSFSIEWSWYPCQNSFGHIYAKDYFLALYSVSLVCVSVFMPVPYCWDCCSSCSKLCVVLWFIRNIIGHSDDQDIFLKYIWSPSTVPGSQLLKPLKFPE